MPVSLFTIRSTPRKRWDARGEIEEVDASHVGLATCVGRLLSDNAQLRNLLLELIQCSDIREGREDTFQVNKDACDRARKLLPAELHRFWKTRALIFAYRSITWKFLEPV